MDMLRPTTTAGSNSPGVGGVRSHRAKLLLPLCIGTIAVIVGFAGVDRWIYEHVALRLNTPSPTDVDFYQLTLPNNKKINIYQHKLSLKKKYLAILTLKRRGWRRANVAFAAGMTAALSAHFLQDAVGRYRPNRADSALEFAPPLAGLIHGAPVGFPSGEAATAFGMAFLLGRDFRRGRVFFAAAAVLVACTRCLFGMHYFSDVVAGAVVGWTVAAVVKLWMQRGLHRLRRVTRPASIFAH